MLEDCDRDRKTASVLIPGNENKNSNEKSLRPQSVPSSLSQPTSIPSNTTESETASSGIHRKRNNKLKLVDFGKPSSQEEDKETRPASAEPPCSVSGVGYSDIVKSSRRGSDSDSRMFGTQTSLRSSYSQNDHVPAEIVRGAMNQYDISRSNCDTLGANVKLQSGTAEGSFKELGKDTVARQKDERLRNHTPDIYAHSLAADSHQQLASPVEVPSSPTSAGMLCDDLKPPSAFFCSTSLQGTSLVHEPENRETDRSVDWFSPGRQAVTDYNQVPSVFSDEGTLGHGRYNLVAGNGVQSVGAREVPYKQDGFMPSADIMEQLSKNEVELPSVFFSPIESPCTVNKPAKSKSQEDFVAKHNTFLTPEDWFSPCESPVSVKKHPTLPTKLESSKEMPKDLYAKDQNWLEVHLEHIVSAGPTENTKREIKKEPKIRAITYEKTNLSASATPFKPKPSLQSVADQLRTGKFSVAPNNVTSVPQATEQKHLIPEKVEEKDGNNVEEESWERLAVEEETPRETKEEETQIQQQHLYPASKEPNIIYDDSDNEFDNLQEEFEEEEYTFIPPKLSTCRKPTTEEMKNVFDSDARVCTSCGSKQHLIYTCPTRNLFYP